MPQQSVSKKFVKWGIIASGIALSGIVLMACNTPAGTSTSSNTDNTTNPDNAMLPESSPMTSPASDTTAPSVPAQSTDQAATNENVQLGKLNQDSTNVDKSLNDQAINVNQ